MGLIVDVPNPRSAPHLDVSREQLDNIAAVAMSIAQADLTGEVVPYERLLIPYAELPEQKRADIRALCYRIVQALVMLGWIEV